MTALLALLGNMPGEVCRDPHLLYKLTSPRFSGELPDDIVSLELIDLKMFQIC